MVKWIALASFVVVAACQGQSGAPEAPAGSAQPASHFGSAAQPVPVGSATEPPLGSDVLAVGSADDGSGSGSDHVKPEEPEVPDASKQIAELGAIPAWQAVVDRAMYLARRDQHGVVYGTLGAPIMVLGPTPEADPDGGVRIDAGMVTSDYTWLVDDTDGNGALAIRVKLGGKAGQVKQGDRVALGGAWVLDEEHRWYWKVDAVSPLSPATPSDLKDPPAPPGHAIRDGSMPGAKMITFAKDGDAVYFQVVGPPPAVDGEGWPVANELGDPPFALLFLPGERASYGGQDMRAPDERWQLKRGTTYAVRIGKIRKKDPDKPALINARTAPLRVM